MEAPDFWEDSSKSAEVLKEAKSLESDIESFKELENLYEDTEVLIELAGEEEDASLLGDIKHSLLALETKINALRTKTLLFGEYDRFPAILKLNAGVGGVEACDWCSMLCTAIEKRNRVEQSDEEKDFCNCSFVVDFVCCGIFENKDYQGRI